MPYCNVCADNGESPDVCSSHNATAFTKCPYHSRHPVAARKPSKSPAKSTDGVSDVAADLRNSVPLAPLFDDSVAALAARGAPPESDVTALTPKELVAKLFAGELTKAKVLEAFTLRLADEAISDKAAKVCERCMASVKMFEVDDLTSDAPASQAAKSVSSLQSKHGKVLGAFMAVHRRVQHDLHINKRSANKPIYEHADTGERVVESSKDGEVESQSVFHLVLVDFGYLCVAHGYLTPTEARALHHWVSHQFYIEMHSLTVIFRATERLLRELDVDHGRELDQLIDARSTRFLDEESALYKPSKQPGGNPGKYVQGDYSQCGITPGDKSLAIPWPRKGICWCYANGVPCVDLDQRGQCRFLRSHSTCGKEITVSGNKTTCTGSHAAHKCPN
jgi:hypothetical protein